MNVNEVMEMNKNKYHCWEIYSWSSKRHSIHSDFVLDVENDYVGCKPEFHGLSEVDKWELMSVKDYSNTILANDSQVADELDEDYFPILVMVLKD